MRPAYLFVYGQLKHDIAPPDTIQSWTPCTITAFMWDRGGDPAIVLSRRGVVHGELQIIDAAELLKLDRIEQHAHYRRTQVLINGQRAWVYVWAGKVPMGITAIERWSSAKASPENADK